MTTQTEVQKRLAAAGLGPLRILQKVGQLIENNKFKQGRGCLRSVFKGEECRCYVGLIAEVLVEEGFYKWDKRLWSNGEEVAYSCVLTDKGVKVLGVEAESHMTGETTAWLGIPRRIRSRNRSLINLNDNAKLSFEAIHALVVKEVGAPT